jgi:hypothetical protein
MMSDRKQSIATMPKKQQTTMTLSLKKPVPKSVFKTPGQT